MHLRTPTVHALSGASFLLATLLLNSQQPAAIDPAQSPTTPTLTLQAQLVNLPVVVRDKNGTLVTTLGKDDFALSVDGRPQTIRYFDRDNNLPLTLGLQIDISGSVRNDLDEERTASEAFLDDMLTAPAGRQPDQAFLIQFAHQVDLLQDLTASVPKLRAGLKRLGDEQQDQRNNNGGNSGRGGYGGRGGQRGMAAGTTLYDSIYLGANEIMQKQQGRKAIIVLTDGEDRGSMKSMSSAIEAAQRAETVVYAIYFKGNDRGFGGPNRPGFGGRGGMPGGGRFPGGGGGGRGGEQQVDGRKVLAQITKETGGRMFEVSGKQTFAAIYTQIGEELRSQYRLGYTPDSDAASTGFHRVELTLTKDKKMVVQTRSGYYGGE
jgi:VWFA-related protein